MFTVRIQSDLIYSIYVVGPFYIHSIQNADDIVLIFFLLTTGLFN